MIRAVLFDLDGTLLDIDLDRFLRAYFALLGPVLSDIVDGAIEPEAALKAVMTSTLAMCESDDDRTNREVFESRFLELTGVDLTDPKASARIDRFYRDEFPGLRHSHGPRPGGIRAVEAARSAGLPIALATNPIFPLDAIEERMRWAGLDRDWFELVTSYETMDACKPNPRYFERIARSLGTDPAECLMVGDDPDLDLPASHTGMRTFYVGTRPVAGDVRRGSLDDLAELLPEFTTPEV